jgi:alkyl sulfatase BDS1-like metallo-beta-lactamase superfamily hydrolase
MRFSLNAERTINHHYTIAFNFGDEVHALEVRRGLAQFHEDYNGTPAVTVNVSKNLFVGILLGTIDFTEKLAEGLITIDGKTQLAPQFFASHDKPAENPRITLR